MDAVKNKKKSKKKLIVTLVILFVVLAVIVGGCSIMVNKAKSAMEAMMNEAQTDVVSVRSLTKSIGATGKVISVQSEDISVPLSGVKIEHIAAEVGDVVEEGQLLVQFDTEDIAENLDIARRALYQTQGQYGISAENAQRSVEDAQRGADYQAQTAYINMNQAYQTYIDAFDDLEELKDKEAEALDVWIEAEEKLDDLMDDLEDAQTAQTDTTALDQKIAQQPSVIAQAEAAYEQAKAARESLEENIPKLYDSYELACLAYENALASGQSTVASAQAAQQSAELSVNTDQQQKQIDALADQLEDGTVTAPFGGVVTAVNYDDGDYYAQGVLLTVQDISSLEIEAQIGEYDIPDIRLGQKVLIKTDATREQELEGTVVFIAPTATPAVASAMGASVSADPTYEVRISVDTQTDRLRLDMSASLSIIVQEVENAMTVPYNAVQTDEAGAAFVEAVNDDGTVTQIPVTVLMESSYYTQIEGDLHEGQTIRVISQKNSDMFSVMADMSGGF